MQIRNPQLEAVACKLEPKVEGRIMQLTPEVNIFRIMFFLVGGEYSIFLEYSPQMQPTPEVNIQYFFISNRYSSYCWLFELIIIFFYFFLEGWQTTVTGVKMWSQGMIWKRTFQRQINSIYFVFFSFVHYLHVGVDTQKPSRWRSLMKIMMRLWMTLTNKDYHFVFFYFSFFFYFFSSDKFSWWGRLTPSWWWTW